MVYTCSVPGCYNRGSRMHCLPKDPEIRRKWCEAINRIDLLELSERKRRSAYRICEKHFKESDKFPENKNRTNIKYTAVPSLFLQTSVLPSNTETVLPSPSGYVVKMPQCCAALGCNHNSQNCHMKNLPSDSERRQKWLHNINRGDWSPKDWDKLCQCHFTEDQFEQHRLDKLRKLVPFAIPTVFNTNAKYTHKDSKKQFTLSKRVYIDVEDDSLIDSEQCYLTEDVDGSEKAAIEKEAAINALQKEVDCLTKELAEVNQEREELEDICKTLFKPDQIENLIKNKGTRWSSDTITEALQIRYHCGLNGYHYLVKLGWPYPSFSTICRRLNNMVPLAYDDNNTS